MISFYRSVAALTFVLLATTLSFNVHAQATCVVKGSTLFEARANFESQCSAQRVDCDPFNGEWFCASFRMNSATPPALTITSSAPAAPQPAVTEPAAQVPVTQAPTQAPATQAPPTQAPATQAPVAPQQPSPTTPAATDQAPMVSAPPASPSAPAASEPAAAARAWPDCVSASNDSDGDGYGWENNATCLVTERSIPTPDVANSTPVAAAPVAPAAIPAQPGQVTAADITDLVLVTGQSNALGAGTGYNTSLDASNSRVFAFTNNGWQVADLRQIWDLRWHPRNDPSTDPSNNFSLHFGKSVAARDDSRVIGFVLATAPGAKIEHWDRDGDFYASVQSKVLDAINQLPHKSAVDGILWHQGESDGEDKQYYTDALYSLIFDLRTEPWIQADAPFICGETKIASVNNRLNGLNRDSDPGTACVRAADLPTLDDDRHYNAEALRTLGARYADAYLRITR